MSTEIQKEKKEEKEENPIYPEQLKIIIRTGVPGYKIFEYKPSMTIKDTTENFVKFNPLIKLNQAVINNIPKEYRIKQFFNSELFKSLLIHNNSKPAKNLLQATRYGYVDNNINITLNSIFPVGSVINIGKKPYVISDHQWTTGDWKIEKKVLDVGEGKNADNRTLFITLPNSILTGNNYSGPPIIIIQPQQGSNSRSMTGGEIPYNLQQDKLVYSITIDMEVHPGTSLTQEQLKQSKCNSRYNAIRKAFAEFTGRPYVIPPVYTDSKNKTKKNIEKQKGGKRKTCKNI